MVRMFKPNLKLVTNRFYLLEPQKQHHGETIVAQLKKETVNKKYSRTWTKINDDGRSDYWRDKFLSIHGGEFTKNGREWVWEDTVEELVQEEPEPIQEGPPPKKIYIVTKPNGEKEEIDNVTQYSKENGLDNGNMYRIVHGKRKSHKGYTIRLKTEGE